MPANSALFNRICPLGSALARPLSTLLPLLMITVALGGCWSSATEDAPEPESEAKELTTAKAVASDDAEGDMVRVAERLFQAGMYTVARDSFQSLRDRFPMGAYAPLAEIKTADSCYFNREYVEAAKRYEEFAKSYPASPDLPYVKLQAAKSLVHSSKGAGRDRAPYERALTLLESIIATYPDSTYAVIADQERVKVATELASYEEMIIEFYRKRENTAAVEARTKTFREKWKGRLTPRLASTGNQQIALNGEPVKSSGELPIDTIGDDNRGDGGSDAALTVPVVNSVLKTVASTEEIRAQESHTEHVGLGSPNGASAPDSAGSDAATILARPAPIAVTRTVSPTLTGTMARTVTGTPKPPPARQLHNPGEQSAPFSETVVAQDLQHSFIQRVLCRKQARPLITIELSEPRPNIPSALTAEPLPSEDGAVTLVGVPVRSIQPRFDCLGEGDLRLNTKNELELVTDDPVLVTTLENPFRLVMVVMREH